ncbi:unnamed protein product [Clavelina lepadiformis]|uniref:Uncharacterized protein n=1 Tax=Clavelina lepadiformis TaxID=159417 RepID=A0ABP0EV18_CLALP
MTSPRWAKLPNSLHRNAFCHEQGDQTLPIPSQITENPEATCSVDFSVDGTTWSWTIFFKTVPYIITANF